MRERVTAVTGSRVPAFPVPVLRRNNRYSSESPTKLIGGATPGPREIRCANFWVETW